MSPSTSLELLPPEIQCHILEQMPDMKTLRALLHASPQYFQVYTRSKEAILSQVTCNQITDSVLPIAVDAFEQQKLREGYGVRIERLSFLEGFRQESLRKSYGFSLKTSKALHQFHSIVEFFMSDFTRTRIAIIENYLHSGNTHLLPHEPVSIVRDSERAFVLSHTEYIRLARAFYHLELYGDLFCREEIFYDDIDAITQSTLFLQRLTEWELEEFLCVRNYLIEKLVQYLDKVEDDFMQYFIEQKAHIIESSGPGSRWISEDWFFSWDNNGRGQEKWFEGCLTRSLPTIKAMLTADTPEARFMAFGNTDIPRNTLSQALNRISTHRSRPSSKWPRTNFQEIEFHDEIEKHNAAWAWLMEDQSFLRFCTSNIYDRFLDGLRRWGYAIWDHERLKHLGVLSKA